MKPLMIGDLAAATGTKVNTIRFYEEIGLLPKAARTSSGRRTYDESGLARLSFIRHGRALGFSISEIRSLMKLADHPERDCIEAAEIAHRHLRDVEERIRRLQALKTELEQVASSCDGGRAADCRVIEALCEAGPIS